MCAIRRKSQRWRVRSLLFTPGPCVLCPQTCTETEFALFLDLDRLFNAKRPAGAQHEKIQSNTEILSKSDPMTRGV